MQRVPGSCGVGFGACGVFLCKTEATSSSRPGALGPGKRDPGTRGPRFDCVSTARLGSPQNRSFSQASGTRRVNSPRLAAECRVSSARLPGFCTFYLLHVFASVLCVGPSCHAQKTNQLQVKHDPVLLIVLPSGILIPAVGDLGWMAAPLTIRAPVTADELSLALPASGHAMRCAGGAGGGGGGGLADLFGWLVLISPVLAHLKIRLYRGRTVVWHGSRFLPCPL